MCKCQEVQRHKAAVANLTVDANLPAESEQMDIDGMELNHPDTRDIVSAAREYIEQQEPPMLYLYGKNGTGKTRIAVAIAKALIEREMPVYFAYFPAMLDDLRRGQFTGRDYAGQDQSDLIDKTRAKGLLILDDLGLYKVTPWAELQVDAVIGYRYMMGLRTVITTNVKLSSLPVRMQSRLRDAAKCRVVVTDAPDYRVNNAPRFKAKKG